MEAIIDTRVKAVIQFHDCLHGFRSGRGTDTAIIEAKLIQQLAAIAGVALFDSFVDLKYAFDSVDHKEGLGILENRGAGPSRELCAGKGASMAPPFAWEEVPHKVDSSPQPSSTSSWTKW